MDWGFSILLLILISGVVAFNLRIFLHKSYLEYLDTAARRERFGSLYEGLKVKQGLGPLSYNIILVARRLLFALIVVYMNEHPIIQLQLYQQISLATLMYLVHVKPFETPRQNMLEVFNELMVLFTSSLLFMFCDIYDTDQKSLQTLQESVGYAVLGLTSAQVSINLLFLLNDFLR